jgi:predicted transcriptional regulator
MIVKDSRFATVALATELTIACINKNCVSVKADEILSFLQEVYNGINQLVATGNVELAAKKPFDEHVPAVTIRKSLANPNYIISLIDGTRYKTLRRHLSSYGLTPEQYRQRYNLPEDYPMVAKNYLSARPDTA